MSTRALPRLVALDLRGRRVLGTVLFVVVTSLASAGIVMGLEGRRSATQLWDRAFDRALAPHVILRAAAPAAPFGSLIADERVSAHALVGERNADLVDGDARTGLIVRAGSRDAPPTVGGPYLLEGRLAATGEEITLERSLVDDLGLAVGDHVRVAAADRAGAVDLAVVGIVLDFQDCFFPQCDPGVAWVAPAGLAALGGPTTATALLRLRDPSGAPAFTRDALSGGAGAIAGAQDWLDTRRDALSVSRFFGAFLAAFGVFVLVAAGVVVAGSVTNRVVARRREIGLLKAVGATPSQVVAAMTLEHLLLGAVSLVIGASVASVLAPRLRIGVAAVLEPSGRALHGTSVVSAVIAVAVIITAATAIPAWRAGHAGTAETLRPPAGGGGRSRLATAAAAAGAGPVVVGGLKDALARPVRTILAAVSIVLAIVALLVSLGLDRSVGVYARRPALTGDPWDATVSAPILDPHTFATEVAAAPGVAAWFYEASSRRPVDGQVVLVRAVGGDPAAAGYVIRDGRALQAAGEAVAGYGLLERIGKRVGEQVTVEVDGRSITPTIVGRYADTEDSGEILLVRWESIVAVVPGAVPDAFRVRALPGTTPATLAAALRTRLGPDASVQPMVVDTSDLDAFRVAFWFVAALVLVVALANLGATVLLGVRERLRDFGVLRAVGYTPRQLVAATVVGTVVLVSGAVAVGVPLGLWVNRGLMRTVGEAMGYGPELGYAPAARVAAAAIAAVAVGALAVGAATCMRSARLTVSELVRYE